MADDKNYISIAMGLDVTDLKAGLSEANKQIQLANSEFKAASSGMDNWQNSIDGVSAKVKQLDTILKMQKSKLAGLQAEYEKVSASQGENSEAARKLKVQINNQQAAVNATQKEFNNYTETLKEAEAGNIDLTQVTLKNGKALKEQGDSAKESSSKMDGLKSVAKGVVGGLVAIATAAVGAVTGFLSLAESTRETRTQLGQLESAYTTAGHSAETARKTVESLTGVLGDQGQATEAAQQLAQLAKSEQELSDYTHILTGVYATFGESLKVEGLSESINHTIKLGEVNGNLADALEWSGITVDDFNAQLANCNTEEERSALIVSTLNGLYGEAADKYKEVNKDVIEAQEAQSKLNNALADLGAIAEPIMTTLKLIAVDLLTTITPFIELIGNGLKGALEGSAGAATTLAEGIGGLLNVLLEKVMNTLPTILNVVLSLAPQLVSTILGMLPELLNVITTLITEIINMVTTMLPQIVSTVMEVLPLLISNLVKAIPQLLNAAIQLLMAIVDAIPVIITSLLKELPKIINTIIDVVIKSIPILLDGAIKLFNAIINAIPVIIKELVKALPNIINTIVNAVINAMPVLLNGAIKLFTEIINAIPKIIPPLIAALPQIITSIVSALTNNMPVIMQAAITLFTEIIKAIPQIAGELIKNMPQIISAIVQGLAEGAGEIAKAGLNIVKGIWEGIKSGANWIKNKITGFAGDVAGWFKDTFKINSPSKLMADEVGLFIGEGIGEGILNSLPYVKKQLSEFSNSITDNLGNIKAGLGGATIGNSGQVIQAGLTVNYNGNLSRKQIKQLENDHYNSIKMRLRMEGAI